jgi:hypothetical protein
LIVEMIVVCAEINCISDSAQYLGVRRIVGRRRQRQKRKQRVLQRACELESPQSHNRRDAVQLERRGGDGQCGGRAPNVANVEAEARRNVRGRCQECIPVGAAQS